jgi:exopolysaccharide biosynthesis polyprenyl glycosylphosphotransferase
MERAATGEHPVVRANALPSPTLTDADIIELDPARPHAPLRRPRHDVRFNPGLLHPERVRDPFAIEPSTDDIVVLDEIAPVADSTASEGLRRTLVINDLIVVAVSWIVISMIAQRLDGHGLGRVPLQAGVATILTMAALRQLRLYQGRICTDRWVARKRLLVATCAAPAVLTVAGRYLGIGLGVDLGLFGTAAAVAVPWAGLVVAREGFEQWLRASRLRGRHVRPIVLAGTPDEVGQIAHLLDAHPETGFRAVGWVGDPKLVSGRAWATELDAMVHLGQARDVVNLVRGSGASGVLVGPTAAAWPAFPKMARQLQDSDLHVQMWSGMWGVSSRRLRPMQLAHEPFFYLERPGALSRTRWIKRSMDIAIASVVLVLASPVLAVAALLIKLGDRGPVVFRQKRVGQHGEIFELRKLRTMTVDAESRLERLKQDNERSGPLFKLTADPRVTKVGKVLRATSIDELPQLLDVLAGKLSLVGPRPALPSEVAQFDHALLDRHDVLPGLTGLWQAEARHNPSFDAYRHLDLFYVENWTVLLDVLILFATVRTVLTDTANAGSSFLQRKFGRRRTAETTA